MIVQVNPKSAAALAGVMAGDEIVAINGTTPRDIIEYQLAIDEPLVEMELHRGGLNFELTIERPLGEPLGIEVSSPIFDRIRTCDNHCEFCFIYQLPKNMRRSLYLKDDDYRLSFLYGNFTTLTRFTEADLERVVEENLSPLYVSIHTTDPMLRSEMLRNKKGATSLRFLKALLENDITVHGQIVVCPGVNDGIRFEETLAGILEEYPKLASVAAVPLGVSRYSGEARMRPHTLEEINYILDAVDIWQDIFQQALSKRMIFAADEYYLLAGRPFPDASYYEDFAQLENGIGMARAFIDSFIDSSRHFGSVRGGFFQSVDGAPSYGYRAPHVVEAKILGAQSPVSEVSCLEAPEQEVSPEDMRSTSVSIGSKQNAKAISLSKISKDIDKAESGQTDYQQDDKVDDQVAVPVLLSAGKRRSRSATNDMNGIPITLISSQYGKKVLEKALANYRSGSLSKDYVDILAVDNNFFGGNTSVTGLLVGEDLSLALAKANPGRRYILPDVCLNEGRFLDGMTPDDLPVRVEIIPAEGDALRKLLDDAIAKVTCAG